MTITRVGRHQFIELIHDIFADGRVSPLINGYSSRGMGHIDKAESIRGFGFGYLFLNRRSDIHHLNTGTGLHIDGCGHDELLLGDNDL